MASRQNFCKEKDDKKHISPQSPSHTSKAQRKLSVFLHRRMPEIASLKKPDSELYIKLIRPNY